MASDYRRDPGFSLGDYGSSGVSFHRPLQWGERAQAEVRLLSLLSPASADSLLYFHDAHLSMKFSC